MTEPTIETVLVHTLALLRNHGWVQGRDSGDDGHCVSGAIRKVFLPPGKEHLYHHRMDEVMWFLVDTLNIVDKGHAERTICVWNDSADDFDDVRVGLEKAIAKAAECGR